MKYVKVEDLGQIVTGNTPPTSDMSNYGNYMPFIKATDIILGSRYTYVTEQGYSEKSYKKYKANIVPKGSTCIVTIGSIGKKMTQAHTDLFVNQAINAILPYKQYDKDYIYYATKYAVLPQLKIYDSGTTSGRENISKSSFSNIRLYVEEDFSTQQKIASILSAYDRLIENNTHRICLLEQMAENLYKEWFVRFRFPEHENVEMVNGLPKGWNKKELGNIADVCMGSSPKSEYYNDEKRGLPFHQGVGSFGERFVLDNTYSTSYSQIAEPMSILFSVRAPVGRLNYTRNRIVIGRGVAAINHKEGMQSLLFYTLKAKFFKEDIIGNGAIFSSITKKELLKLKLIVANKELRVVFNNKINKIDREIDILYKQNQLLTRQRDLLLPRLMSGKLEVKS